MFKYECFVDLVIPQLMSTDQSHFLPLHGGLGFITIRDTSHSVLGTPDATEICWHDCRGQPVMSVTERECNVITASVLEGKLILVRSDGMVISIAGLEGRVSHCPHPLLQEEGIMEARFSSSGDAAFLTFRSSFVLLYGGLNGLCVETLKMESMASQTPLMWDMSRFDKKLNVVAVVEHAGKWLLLRLSEDACGEKVLKKKPRKVVCRNNLTAVLYEDFELAVFRGFEFETLLSSFSVDKETTEIFILGNRVGWMTKGKVDAKIVVEDFELFVSPNCVVCVDREMRLFEPFEHSIMADQPLDISVVEGFAFLKEDDAELILTNLGMFKEALKVGKQRERVVAEWLKYLISNAATSDDEIMRVYSEHGTVALYMILKECIRADRIKLAMILIEKCENDGKQKVDFYLLLKLPERALEVESERMYAWEQLAMAMTVNQILTLVVQRPEFKASLEEYALESSEPILRALYLLDDRVDELAWYYVEKRCESLEERKRNVQKARELNGLTWSLEVLEEALLYIQFLEECDDNVALARMSVAEAIKYLKELKDSESLEKLLRTLKISEKVKGKLL